MHVLLALLLTMPPAAAAQPRRRLYDPLPGREPISALVRTSSLEVEEGDYALASIRHVVRAHASELRFCHEEAVQNRRAAPSAAIALRIAIDGAGAVTYSEIVRSTITDERERHCFAQALRRWTYVPPPRAPPVTVTISLELSVRRASHR